MLLAARGIQQPNLVTVPFASSQTWVAPAGTSLLSSVTGHGVNGVASTPDTTYQQPSTYTLTTTYTEVFNDGAETGNTGSTTEPATASSSVPAFYCTAFVSGNYGNGHYNRCLCFEYVKNEIPGASGGSPGTPGETGASATGFGKIFDGGTPSAPTAATTNYSNVPVTPGASYPVVVPSGAMITITYYA